MPVSVYSPCPRGDDCALNNGAVHAFCCGRDWPPNEALSHHVKHPTGRVQDPDAIRAKVLADPSCRSCGRPGSDGHHIVPKGSPHFGDDVLDNIACLCHDDHMILHGVGGEQGIRVRAAIGRGLAAEEIRYVVWKLGGSAAREFLWTKYLVSRNDERYG